MAIPISSLSTGIAITAVIIAAVARHYKRVWTSDFFIAVAIMSLIEYYSNT